MSPMARNFGCFDTQSVADALDRMGFGDPGAGHLDPVQSRGGDVHRIGDLFLQLGQECSRRPAGPAHHQLYAATGDRLDDVVDLPRYLRPSSSWAPMNPVSWVKDSISSTANSAPGNTSRTTVTSLVVTSACIVWTSMTSMDGTSTTAAPFEQTPSGPSPASLAMSQVIRGGRPVIGMTMNPGVLGRSDGADGPFAERAVGPQQSAIEVGGDQRTGRASAALGSAWVRFHRAFDHLIEATAATQPPGDGVHLWRR